MEDRVLGLGLRPLKWTGRRSLLTPVCCAISHSASPRIVTRLLFGKPNAYVNGHESCLVCKSAKTKLYIHSIPIVPISVLLGLLFSSPDSY
jgi:hypothetical protein